jgi:hypothetical protein
MSSKTLDTIFWAAAIGGPAIASVQSFESGNPAAGLVLAITTAVVAGVGYLGMDSPSMR